uniref:DUF5641 domain-containing protein n=1 Tax=Anopheles minimus TaxID=112268 RepID=A0A182WMM9_9DIPT
MNRGMPLRKWASNDPTAIQEVPKEHLDTTVQIGDRQAIKMLGLAWCPTEDTFQIIIDNDFHLPVSSLTKRCLVARIAKLYDPVGILQPVIVTAKILMQDLWRENLTWDESVPQYALSKWNEFTAQLPNLHRLHIPRMALPSEAETILHGFCDASKRAYGCAIYLRYLDEDGGIQSRLVCSKSRVAPLKELTLPRLELQAALLLAELYVRIKDVFGTRIRQTKWWTDSQVALTWIRSDNSKWDVFVKNRVAKIQIATNSCDWHYVPTKLNPADIVSRGLAASKLVRKENMKLWLNGPDFIVTGSCPQPIDGDVAILEEVETLPRLLTATVGPDCEDLIAQYKYHNSFIKTRRHFAWINRAIHNLRIKVMKQRATTSYVERRTGPLLLDELEGGLQLLLRVMQATSFPNEVQEMHKSGRITSKGPLQHLNPVVRDNLIYVQGRLANAEMTDDAKLPILVPKSHPFSRTIIRYLHEYNYHAGTDLVMAEFRSKFWMRDLRGHRGDIAMYCMCTSQTQAIRATNGTATCCPTHFLIARASFSIPATIQDDDTDGVKTRWKRVQKLAQQFWTRWRTDYLSQLRCHAKWTKRSPNAQVGQIVLVGDDNLQVGRWPFGIITKTHVGPDGIVRGADVRTSSGTYKRNVRLLAPLPIDATEEEDNDAAMD